MKALFYSHDVGPSKNLARVARVAIDRNHKTLFCGGGVDPGNISKSDGFDVLVTGLSSYDSGREIELGQELGIPWVVVADVHSSWARPAAKGLVEKAHALVAAKDEIQEEL